MKLPRAESAIVPEQKVTHYLLNPAHPVGGSKAVFFLSFGYASADWARFAEALRRLACEHDVAATELTPHGTRYVVDGRLPTPSGRDLNVRTAWFIDVGSEVPRFITAHPLPKL